MSKISSTLGLKHFGICFSLALCLAFSMPCSLKTKSTAEAAAQKSKNENALALARENIERFRKGDGRIKVLDAKGAPVKNAQISIRQISHDFKFGCYLKIDDLAPEKLPQYEEQFAHLFNYAVIGTFWSFVENERGAENWSWFEREKALAQKLNLRIEAVPVLWGTSEFGTPKWLPREKEKLVPVLKKRIESTLGEQSGVVEDWEIVNEPLAPADDFFARYAGSDYIETAFRQARQSAPLKRLLINEYGVFGAAEKSRYNREKYFQLLKRLIEKQVPIDVIGIQAHANGEWFEPATVAAELERYASLGKPLQITEFSTQTLDFNDGRTPLKISGDYRSGVWDNDRQAEFYREFYTICFGSAQVEAITTWGLDDERAWLPGIGLVDPDGRPKKNYQTLDKLINEEWRTNLKTTSDAAGDAAFRGFYGDYEIEVTASPRAAAKSKFVLRKNADNDLTIYLKG